MITTSALYNTIWEDPRHIAETKIVCGANTYNQSQILNCERSQSLYGDQYGVGNTVINEIQFSLMGATAADIPRMSRVEIWTRLWNGTRTASSEWLPMGVFITAKPDYDTESGIVKVRGYDEMIKTNVVPFEQGSTVTTWSNPTLQQVAQHITAGTNTTGKIETNYAGVGIDLEDATQVPDDIIMPAIPYTYTVREILADIAAAAGGNWTVVFQNDGNDGQVGKLRLIK